MLFAVAKAVIKLKIELKAPRSGLTTAPCRNFRFGIPLQGKMPDKGDAKGLLMILRGPIRAQEGCKVSERSHSKS